MKIPQCIDCGACCESKPWFQADGPFGEASVMFFINSGVHLEYKNDAQGLVCRPAGQICPAFQRLAGKAICSAHPTITGEEERPFECFAVQRGDENCLRFLKLWGLI